MSTKDKAKKQENDSDTSRRHKKTPSLRELMLGKKTVKALPENFFERVLELEIKLKKGFRIDVLQELVNYYSSAIEYYESIEDPRYRDFQMSLNVLLSQPEILKKMTLLNKATPIEPNSYSSKYLKKEHNKKQMKMKVEYAVNTQNSTQNMDNKVKEIMKEVDKPQNDIESIVNKDLVSQEENFKKRRDEKRRKSLLSTSDLTDHIQTLKNKGLNLSSNNRNKSFVLEDKDKCMRDDYSDINFHINITPDMEGEMNDNNLSFTGNVTSRTGINDDVTPGNNNFLRSLNNSFDKQIEDLGNDLSFDRTDTPNNKSTLTTSKLKTPRHMQIFNDLKFNMDTFLQDFNNFFFEDVFQNVVDKITHILEEKHKKTLVISKDYNNQIKEYEFLITCDNEGSYKESLQSTIDQLKEELQTELEKLDDQYDQLLKENKHKFRTSSLRSNSGIQLVEEKFRLDMFNSISNMLFPKTYSRSNERKESKIS